MNKTTTPTNSRNNNGNVMSTTTEMIMTEKAGVGGAGAGGQKRDTLLKRSMEVVGNSQRKLKETIEIVSNHGLMPLSGMESSSMDQPALRRLKRYIKIHNEQSNAKQCFEVGYSWQKRDGWKTDRKVLCIGCKECSYKLFPRNNNNNNNNNNANKMITNDDNNNNNNNNLNLNLMNNDDKEANEKKWKLEEETKILADMEEHVTTHYVTFAKIILWIIEAFFSLIVNYYNQ